MKHLSRSFILLMAMSGICTSTSAQLTLKDNDGWLEAAWMEFNGLSSDYSHYNAYVSANGTDWKKLDGELIRSYGSYGRVDALGLAPGSYTLKVVPVKGTAEITDDAIVSSPLTVKAYNRDGYAHDNTSEGIGAYNNDGTLKDGARVIYVTKDNAKTVTLDMKTNNKGGITTCTGIQNIITAYEKGQETRPLAIRFIGTFTKDDMPELGSSAIGLQVKGKSHEMNLTLEGVGNDATFYGFGILVRASKSVELRNFAIMLQQEDGISFDTKNEHLWGHNLDIFYGKNKGGDKSKGDGSFDVKGTMYSTVSANHFWDTGKCTLNSNKDEVDYITYHHNWYDHSDSRHPRVRISKHLHVFNNYYDGNSKYGIGATTGSSIFAENNYFRNCAHPMLISQQGSDIHNGVGDSKDTKGSFSNEDGGIIKAYGNYMTGETSFEPYDANDATYSKHFDAFVAKTRDEVVPSTVIALKGSTGYSNFDTAEDFYKYTADAANDVPANVTGTYGAGRCQQGDLKFTFDNGKDDASSEINTDLETVLKNYKSGFVKIIGFAENTEATAIATPLHPQSSTSNAYALNGQRATPNTKGVIIKDGKKCLN